MKRHIAVFFSFFVSFPGAAEALTRAPLTVITGQKRIELQVEIAQTPEEQRQGLMHRTRLEGIDGMLFPFDAPRQAAMWMKDTPLALDMVFIGEEGHVQKIVENATPYSTDPISAPGLVTAVLELPAGKARALGLHPGDRITYAQ